jgi:hypothetical protein
LPDGLARHASSFRVEIISIGSHVHFLLLGLRRLVNARCIVGTLPARPRNCPVYAAFSPSFCSLLSPSRLLEGRTRLHSASLCTAVLHYTSRSQSVMDRLTARQHPAPRPILAILISSRGLCVLFRPALPRRYRALLASGIAGRIVARTPCYRFGTSCALRAGFAPHRSTSEATTRARSSWCGRGRASSNLDLLLNHSRPPSHRAQSRASSRH